MTTTTTINGNGSSLVAVVLKDLETRVIEWNTKVETERALLKSEWESIEKEKQKLLQRKNTLDEASEEISNGLSEIQKLKQELEKRLEVTPMDLTAQQLQQEWIKIDQEKALIKQSAEELQLAIERLADAQAALDLMN